jgi:hypothetical protein
MRRSFEKFFLFTLLGILLFSFPGFLTAANTDNSGLLTNPVSGERLIELVSSTPDSHRTATAITFQSRWEFYEVLFGTYMVIVGLVAVAVALYRWKAEDLSLIAFGIFCFFYGARTRAFQFLVDAPPIFWAYWRWFLIYLTPVPAYIFFEQFIDTENQTAAYAGAGHPPLLLWHGSEQKITEYREKGIILGQFEDARYQNIALGLKSGDRFILCTDGIFEATNAAGDLYGWDRFKQFITSQASLSAGNFADGLLGNISSWSGKHLDEALDDDLTLLVVDFEYSGNDRHPIP